MSIPGISFTDIAVMNRLIKQIVTIYGGVLFYERNVTSIAEGFHLFEWDEAEGCGVDAVAESAAVGRPVGKYVTEVGAG